ncbi:MAG: thioredoxin family protein [Alphaproteobacteria bacterium]|nr:thioredoxin family protein [Alphaproteobacteria bacterium]
MKIQILGTGCPKCNALAQATETAVRELGLDCQMEKVTDMQEIVSFGVMSTPALVVDGKVKCSGRIPGSDEMKELLK